jgi:hypothetical protein
MSLFFCNFAPDFAELRVGARTKDIEPAYNAGLTDEGITRIKLREKDEDADA